MNDLNIMSINLLLGIKKTDPEQMKKFWLIFAYALSGLVNI